MKAKTKARIVVYGITFFLAVLFLYGNIQRANAPGGYFADPFWITFTAIIDGIFFSFLLGIVVAEFGAKLIRRR